MFFIMTARNRILAIAAGLVLAGGIAASPAALAAGPSSGPAGVSGQVAVSPTMTLSLTANSFTFSPVIGTMTHTPITGSGGGSAGIQANVNTNDILGYALAESMNADLSGDTAFEVGNNQADELSWQQIQPYVYPGGPGSTPSFPPYTSPVLGNASAYGTIAHTSAVSVVTGDIYQLAWDFDVTNTTPTGTYVGGFQVLVLGN